VEQEPTPKRRRRSDTLPLATQVVSPRVVAVGIDPDVGDRIAKILEASELARHAPADAGEEIQETEPDLVVVNAAAEGGLAVVRELKLLPETHFTAVIAVGPPELRTAAYAAGVDHFVEETLPADELRARAGALLRTSSFLRALRQSRHELRLRRDWVRYLVHDLRNFLTKAIGDLALATRKAASDPDAAKGLVARGEEELWRCSSLLNDLLDVDRIKKGQLNLRLSHVNLLEVAAQVARTFRDAAERARVEIRVIGDGAVAANVDAALVERLLANLVSNALRYAPAETAIGILAQAGEGRAVLEVENRGPSIPPEKTSEIFEPFVKPDDGPNAAGAGLGLAFCRLAVDLHGGTIGVSEPEGGGARFRVELPT
jgi:two-component system sensor histidine kinase/response regulator